LKTTGVAIDDARDRHFAYFERFDVFDFVL